LLKAVFMSAGASADDAEKWLTALNSRRPGSDGNAGTGTLGRNDHATLIRTADELGVIAGMPAATFRCIRPALTVYTGLQNVDKRYAAAIVRRALTNPTTGEAAPVLDVPAPDAAGGESFAGRVFSIQATVVGENSRFFQRVILRVTGDPGRPYLLALWDESGDEDSAGDTGTDCR
jgi:type II secretory pathway component PulK